MTDATDTEGTPRWLLQRLIEISVLLPTSILFIAGAASPALAYLWWLDSGLFSISVVVVLWLGASIGSRMAREDLESHALDPEEVEQDNLLIFVVVLGVVVSSMMSVHILGVTFVTNELPLSSLPSSVVILSPAIVSYFDLLLAQKTGYSMMMVGFWIAWGFLKVLELTVSNESGSLAEVGAGVGNILKAQSLLAPR